MVRISSNFLPCSSIGFFADHLYSKSYITPLSVLLSWKGSILLLSMNKFPKPSKRRKNKGRDLRPLLAGHGHEEVEGEAAAFVEAMSITWHVTFLESLAINVHD
jgi:hypothetical protein